MRNILLLLLILLLGSCGLFKRHRFNYDDVIHIYKYRFTPQYVYYLTIKLDMNTFDDFTPYFKAGVIGDIRISNDTLHLLPRYEYNSKRIWEIDPRDTAITTVPQQYLIRGDKLIDITDFSNYPLLNSFFGNKDGKYKPTIFKRVRKFGKSAL